MATINEVIERVGRARPDAIDDRTKAAWLIELDGKLMRDVILRHEAEEIPETVKAYPEDGDKPLLAAAPDDIIYELYLLCQADFYNREYDNYNNSALAFNTALDEWKKAYHRAHMPLGAALKNVF